MAPLASDNPNCTAPELHVRSCLLRSEGMQGDIGGADRFHLITRPILGGLELASKYEQGSLFLALFYGICESGPWLPER